MESDSGKHSEQDGESLYATEHEVRLITGLCMAKASFLYLAIVDCVKRVSMELAESTEAL